MSAPQETLAAQLWRSLDEARALGAKTDTDRQRRSAVVLGRTTASLPVPKGNAGGVLKLLLDRTKR